MTLFLFRPTFTINLWHRKFVTADVNAVCQQSTWYSTTRTRL